MMPIALGPLGGYPSSPEVEAEEDELVLEGSVSIDVEEQEQEEVVQMVDVPFIEGSIKRSLGIEERTQNGNYKGTLEEYVQPNLHLAHQVHGI